MFTLKVNKKKNNTFIKGEEKNKNMHFVKEAKQLTHT